MTENRCVCPRCIHPSCPLPNAEPPYDEITHQIDDNFLSVKIPKTAKQVLSEESSQHQDNLSFDFNCADSEGESPRGAYFRAVLKVSRVRGSRFMNQAKNAKRAAPRST